MINFVLHRLIAAGFDAHLVGGCVRDTLLKRPVTDWDIATSATPAEVERLFDKTIKTGERFGTITVIHDGVPMEVTTYRRDGIYRDNRHPAHVTFGASLDEDLLRRDFTINAMAMTESGEIIDPVGGLRDLERGVIRAVGDPAQRFTEDALRMFRAFRFKAQLGFTIAPETLQAILKHAHTAGAISPERIAAELTKTLMSDNPDTVWEITESGLLAAHIPCRGGLRPSANTGVSMDSKFGVDDGRPQAAPTGVLSTLPKEHDLRWGVFCVLVGDGTMAHKLRLPAKTQRICEAGVYVAQAGFPQTRAGIKHLLSKHPPDAVKSAAAVVGTLQSVDEILQSGECCTIKTLAISGQDLIAAGIPEGPAVGAILQKLLNHVIDCPQENEKIKLLRMLKALQ
ncbi:MAG: polynucleotide adenylyltransferase [Oscillospiraceae bacterium]|nr:polynucleotide adenylyltransferase [Oscillospiraceae bacterium]